MQHTVRAMVSSLALFGALGAGTTAHAAALICPSQTDPNAGRTSAVPSTAVETAPGLWTYSFKACNTSGVNQEERIFLMRDWELPWDDAGGIGSVQTPYGWAWSVETIGVSRQSTGWDGNVPTWFNPTDPFYDERYLDLTKVLHFYTCGSGGCYGQTDQAANGFALFPGEGIGTFSFTSPFSPTNAPYQASWVIERPRSGDPAFPNPGGPNTPGLRVPGTVSEPSGLALFALSLGGLMAARARRRQSQGDGSQ